MIQVQPPGIRLFLTMPQNPGFHFDFHECLSGKFLFPCLKRVKAPAYRVKKIICCGRLSKPPFFSILFRTECFPGCLSFLCEAAGPIENRGILPKSVAIQVTNGHPIIPDGIKSDKIPLYSWSLPVYYGFIKDVVDKFI